MGGGKKVGTESGGGGTGKGGRKVKGVDRKKEVSGKRSYVADGDGAGDN